MRSKWTVVIGPYLFAVAVTAAATAITAGIAPLKEQRHSMLFAAAVIASAWVGGNGPGLLAIGLSFFGYLHFIVPPSDAFIGARWPDLIRMTLFLMLAVAFNTVFAARTKTLESLRESRRRLNDVFAAVGVGLWELDLDSDSVSLSPGFESMVGRTGKNLPLNYAGLLACVHPADQARWNERFLEAARIAESFEMSHRLQRADKSIVSVNTRVRFLRDETDGRHFAIGVATAINDSSTARGATDAGNSDVGGRAGAPAIS
jgi:PAS domain-containing protein